jgi:hypothetical protein
VEAGGAGMLMTGTALRACKPSESQLLAEEAIQAVDVGFNEHRQFA